MIASIFRRKRGGVEDADWAARIQFLKIDRVFEFEKAKDAFAHLYGGSHDGKIVIRC